jgi:hypothetical protein
MSKILIETYRGFDIEFDTECEKFQCICTEEEAKESKSFAAVKGFVDEYKKANQGFKPFWIEGKYDDSWKRGEKHKVIGLRKDNRFVIENPDGTKDQISDYDIKYYMLFKESNVQYKSQLDDLEAAKKLTDETYRQNRDAILAKLDIITLYDYKKTLTE